MYTFIPIFNILNVLMYSTYVYVHYCTNNVKKSTMYMLCLDYCLGEVGYHWWGEVGYHWWVKRVIIGWMKWVIGRKRPVCLPNNFPA